MLKKRIVKDEWWPVYDLFDWDDFGDEIEISKEEYSAYKSMMKEFEKWQTKLRKMYNEKGRCD